MIIPFAETNFRNQRKVFGIKTDDRRRHVYVVGKTGTGKTTLLKNMMISDILAGNGVAVADPHGEFAESILDYVPEHRINDVVYFNPADLDFPIAFNAMENVKAKERHLISSGLIAIFKKIWADSWGPRLEYVLRNALLALLENPNSTLLGVMRMLADKEYRKQVVENVTDPVVKQFWVDEFSKYSTQFAVEAVAPIQNKVGQFLTNPMVRNIVGQPHSAINMREIMDSKKILILNLSKGRIGEDSSSLLGAMLITKIQQAAMSRIEIADEEQRTDFYLYVDEFQNFATESFAGILSEARKYRLNLILAHQYIAQLLVEPVRDAVLGNAGTLICFRIGADDAEFFEKEFSPEVTSLDLVNLPNIRIYLKLMIDGVASRAFSADTLPPIPKPAISYKDLIIENSRKKYGTPMAQVEEHIVKWSLPASNSDSPARVQGSSAAMAPVFRKEQRYSAQCSECGAQTTVPFVPDPKRKVFCKDCLKKERELKETFGGARQTFGGRKQRQQLADSFSVPKTRRDPDLKGLREILENSLDEAERRAGTMRKSRTDGKSHEIGEAAISQDKQDESPIKLEDIQNF